jgi:tRNA A-37 threonylcarbamoyl transferase component Bud32
VLEEFSLDGNPNTAEDQIARPGDALDGKKSEFDQFDLALFSTAFRGEESREHLKRPDDSHSVPLCKLAVQQLNEVGVESSPVSGRIRVGDTQADDSGGPTGAQFESTLIASIAETAAHRLLEDLISREASDSKHLTERPASLLRADQRLGRYQVRCCIGAGAMGEVYEATDPDLNRRVAIKISKLVQHDDSTRKRMLKEARACASLDHSGICRIFDFGEFEGRPWLCIEFVEGRPLSEVLKLHGTLAGAEAALIVARLADALAHAHERDVIHRDLKPANIMVRTDGSPVVMDFGLAVGAEPTETTRLTQPGMLVGTPAYMSPEQIDGDPTAVIAQSDIYSLGAVLYHVVTGAPPYSGTITQLIRQIAISKPIPPHELRPDIDVDLSRLCVEMLSRIPSDRPPSMRHVATRALALAEALKHARGVSTATGVPAPKVNPATQLPAAKDTRTSPSTSVLAALFGRGRIRLKRWLILGVIGIAFGLPMAFVLQNMGSTSVRVLVDPGHWLLVDGIEPDVSDGVATVQLKKGSHVLQLMNGSRLIRSRQLRVPEDVTDFVSMTEDPSDSKVGNAKVYEGEGPYCGFREEDVHQRAPRLIQVQFGRSSTEHYGEEASLYFEALPCRQRFEVIADGNPANLVRHLPVTWYVDGNPQLLDAGQLSSPAAVGPEATLQIPAGTHTICAFAANARQLLGLNAVEHYSPAQALGSHNNLNGKLQFITFYVWPDLTYDKLHISDKRLKRGGELNVKFDVWNCGGVRSEPGFVRVLFNKDDLSTAIGLLHEFELHALDANERRSFSVDIPVHETVPSGEYVVTVDIDPTHSTLERDELSSTPNAANSQTIAANDPLGVPRRNNTAGLKVRVD